MESLDETMPERVLDPTAAGAGEDRPFFERVKDIFR